MKSIKIPRFIRARYKIEWDRIPGRYKDQTIWNGHSHRQTARKTGLQYTSNKNSFYSKDELPVFRWTHSCRKDPFGNDHPSIRKGRRSYKASNRIYYENS